MFVSYQIFACQVLSWRQFTMAFGSHFKDVVFPTRAPSEHSAADLSYPTLFTDTRVLKQIMSNDHSFYSWRDKSTLIFHLVPSQIASIVTSPACKNTIRSSHFLLPSRACPSTVAASAHINNKSQNLQSNANMYHNAKPNVTLPASIL